MPMNAYWREEMRRNAAREQALLNGPDGDFYRRWKEDGSPNMRAPEQKEEKTP